MDDYETDIQYDDLELCFERRMMNGEDIEDCFGYGGETIGVWPNGDSDRCYRRLVIKADELVSQFMYDNKKGVLQVGPCDIKLRDFMKNYINKCPEVERITILGSEFAMRKLKVVNSNCVKEKTFEAFVTGINVSKSPSVVVSCLSKRGDGPTLHPIKVYYH